MAPRNTPEQLGTFTYGQYRDVIGRVTPPVEIEDVYSFGVNQNTLVGVVADLAPTNITYTYLSPSSPGFSERSSRLGDRLVNINFTLAKDSNNNGYCDNSDQILFTVLDGQNNIPALNLTSGRYFLIYADDQERYGGADLPSLYNTRVHFFAPDNSFAWSYQVAQNSTLAISSTNATQTEGNSGNKAFTFTVTRSGLTTGTNSVNWVVTGTSSNPASAADFGGTLPSGIVTFAAKETSKVISVNVSGDTSVEPDESFTVTLSNPTNGATLTTATATGTITNDDVVQTVNLAIAPTNATQTEGNSGNKAFNFTVTRSGTTTGTNAVNWVVTGTGIDATDFGGTLPSGIVTFAANETSKVITVNVSGDTTVEPNESFTVILSNPTNGATITTVTATGLITNDDLFTGTPNTDTLTGTNGADTLIGLAGNDTYTVNHVGDIVTEALNAGTDSVNASISYTLTDNVENLTLTGSSNINGTGNRLNNTLTGNSGNNTLTGNAGNDTLNGNAGRDTLTGGVGSDIFVFQFRQSPVSGADIITDFAIGTDRIDLLSSSGGVLAAPTRFARAANSTATTLTNVVNNVFTDANGGLTGNQALGVNSSALVNITSSGIAGTYLVINDGVAGFQSGNDLLVNITGYSGTLPALGNIAVGNFFI